MLLRVMIVDDEYLLRELIKTAVPWGDLGFEIVAEAEDGEEALTLIEKFRPQVVLIDINIPFINGLELAHLLRRQYPHLKIIIVTGYGEFEYAREAIRAGVSSYIVKPVNGAELAQTLRDIQEEIRQEEDRQEKLSRLQATMEESFALRRERFLSSLLSKQENGEAPAAEGLSYFQAGIVPERLAVLVIEPNLGNLEPGPPAETESQPAQEEIRRIVDECLGEFGTFVSFLHPTSQIVVFLNERPLPLDQIRDSYRAAVKIGTQIRALLESAVSIGIGGCHDTYGQIYCSYREALLALENQCGAGDNRVFEYQPMESRELSSLVMNFDKDEFLATLRIGDPQKAAGAIAKIFQAAAATKLPKEYAKILVMEVYSLVVRYAKEVKIQPRELDDPDLLMRLNQVETVSELQQWITAICETTLSQAEDAKKSHTALGVEKAKKYIETHYNQPMLSLEEIADHVFVNPCYLSCVFRKETGQTIIDYLTKYRLHKAKEMIDADPNCQISILAEQVGYNDPYYFSKCFKKYYGITPSKYLEEKNR